MSKIGEKIIRDMRDSLQAEQKVRGLEKAKQTYEAEKKKMRDLLQDIKKTLDDM
jgi:ketol-acid reductoisomerase